MQSRSGFALLTVLVLTVLLALACYQFATTMLHEHQAAAGFGRQVQLRAAADSGLEYVAALLDAGITREELVDNEARLRSVALPGERQPTFSVVTSESASAERSVCYGLENLSTRIHLNAVASWDSAVGRQLLLALPGMTADVADGILDWIDADHKPREFGAEISNFPTSPFGFRNGPLRSIDEMLLIPGVTPEQLYGEDANGNGLLDRNEDDGEVSLPIDNADGLLDKGWAQWITLRSAEKNVRADGTPRINVNAASLGELFDELQAAIDINAAKFVVAYRLYGPFSPDGSLTAPASKHTAPQSEVGDDGAVVTTERAGLVLNSGPRFDINSIYDLVSVQVPYVDESGALLSSPWKLGKSPDSDFLAMEDLLTVDPAIRIVGRLRIADCNSALIAAALGINEELAEAINESYAASTEPAISHLLLGDFVDLATMRQVAPMLTAGGQVYRAQVVAGFEKRHLATRLEATFDTTRVPTQILDRRPLARLGAGYSMAVRERGTEHPKR